jgi:hypothetical protein
MTTLTQPAAIRAQQRGTILRVDKLSKHPGCLNFWLLRAFY